MAGQGAVLVGKVQVTGKGQVRTGEGQGVGGREGTREGRRHASLGQRVVHGGVLLHGCVSDARCQECTIVVLRNANLNTS